jgi:predicted metal-binding protein
VTLTDIARDEDAETRSETTVYVCTTCRKPGDPEDGPRPGRKLARATAAAAQGTGVRVCEVECLANCSRSLSAAIRCPGSWTYIFGGLEADRDAPALIEGARLLSLAADGLLPWRGRPDVLKRGLIARVPPLDLTEGD